MAVTVRSAGYCSVWTTSVRIRSVLVHRVRLCRWERVSLLICLEKIVFTCEIYLILTFHLHRQRSGPGVALGCRLHRRRGPAEPAAGRDRRRGDPARPLDGSVPPGGQAGGRRPETIHQLSG